VVHCSPCCLFTILPSYGNGLVQSIYTAKPKTETGFGFSKSITAKDHRARAILRTSEASETDQGHPRSMIFI